MSFNRYHKYPVLVILSIILASCAGKEHILYSFDDLNGSHIAVLDHSVDVEDFNTIFPEMMKKQDFSRDKGTSASSIPSSSA